MKRNVKILIIDDDLNDCLLIKNAICNIKCLDFNNFEVDCAHEYLMANDKIINGEYDICLVDYKLGIDDGTELIKSARTHGIDKPLILITGHDNYETDLKAMENGADCYFSKKSLQSPNFQKVIRYAIHRQKRNDFEIPKEYHELMEEALSFKF